MFEIGSLGQKRKTNFSFPPSLLIIYKIYLVRSVKKEKLIFLFLPRCQL